MTPFSVQKLSLLLESKDPKNFDIVNSKFLFCVEFESELNINKNNYSEDVYDYFYNLYEYRKTFRYNRWLEILEDSLNIDFKNIKLVTHYINNIYEEMIRTNSSYFLNLFKFKSHKIDGINNEFLNRAEECREIILNY